MNKSALRNFAVWARRDLIKRISDRANLLGVYEDKPTKTIQAETSNGFVINGVTFNYKKEMRDDFIKRVGQIGYQDTIEEIAYTWFNRIVALRFMEVNGYLKNGNGDKLYVIGSTSAGKTEPDAITYADKLTFVDKFKVYDYQDANDTNGLYRYILTSLCNNLNEVMPLMFEKIDNYAELLLPDHLLDKGAIIDHLVNDISAKDFNIIVKDEDGENASQVEIVGWLYQFYISERKDEISENKNNIQKGTLPAVTQIFTPDWIVRYMTENSLGKMWIDSHKSSHLKQCMKYFVEEAKQAEEIRVKIDKINNEYASKKVTEITFIDPCCGSGHILVYAFDLFFKMYQESGFIASEIPELILKNNLFGIDVDKRAAQLTSFALTMKALSYDKDFLSKKVYPNVIDIKESNEIDQLELKDFIRIAKLNSKDEEVLLDLIEKFKDAELYGSLIKDFNYSTEQYDILLKVIEQIDDVQFNLIDALAIHNVKPIIIDLVKQAIILSSKYDVVVTNPPYLSTSTNEKLKDFAMSYYPDSKADLFAMFMETNLIKNNGYKALVTSDSWMFNNNFIGLRQKLIDNKIFNSMLHIGSGRFEAGVSTTSFIIRDFKISNYISKIYKMNNGENFEEIDENKIRNFNFELCKSINGTPFVYWKNDNFYENFKNNKLINDYTFSDGQLKTGDNDKFLRLLWEIDNNKIGKDNKWALVAKGGNFRKWSGNIEYVVDWSISARKHYREDKVARIPKEYIWFKKALCWNHIGGTSFAARLLNGNSIFETAAPAVFLKDEKNINYLLAFLNSIVGTDYISSINPTLSTNVNNITNQPFIIDNNKFDEISNSCQKCISISDMDWNQYETSFDFQKNPLVKKDTVEHLLENLYCAYKNIVNSRFDELKHEEEKLNKYFIEIYGLDNELVPNISDKDITTTHLFDTKKDIPETIKNNFYVKTKQDVVKDLISYIVGCAFGRYSPYKDGLVFAGGEFNYDQYLEITKSLEQPLTHNGLQNYAKSFMPSEENCIMITDNEYGKNDMTSYVVDFITKIYGREHLQENLKFIANALDEKSTDIPANVIRDYLANDFYKDHCKKYQNRPIYWQFDSGKNGGFRALMYLHRYDQNTIPTARLSYLHDIQWKYEQEKERLEKYIENSSIASERTKAQKQLDLINKQILECRAYDEVLNHASNMNITLDLDDGVKVNYQKMQKLDGDKDKNILSTYLTFKEK